MRGWKCWIQTHSKTSWPALVKSRFLLNEDCFNQVEPKFSSLAYCPLTTYKNSVSLNYVWPGTDLIQFHNGIEPSVGHQQTIIPTEKIPLCGIILWEGTTSDFVLVYQRVWHGFGLDLFNHWCWQTTEVVAIWVLWSEK